MSRLVLAARASAAACALIAQGLFCGQAMAAGAPAGVAISNVAQVNYSIGGTPTTTSSTPAVITVAEILDVVVTLQSPTTSVTPGATDQTLIYRVTNTGNGPETYLLTMTDVLPGDEFDPVAASPSIYIDTDNSNSLTPADTPYVPGNNDPTIVADGFVNVIVVNNIPNGLANGDRGFTRLTADSRTGTGAPGTVFSGAGVGGTDAVAGTTGATGQNTGTYVVGDVQVAITKSAAVIQDPFGGSPARPVPGARIRYTLTVTATGSGTAVQSAVVDPIPANTTYLPGSLTLNAAPLTDGADADVGSFTTSPSPRVVVSLGDLTAASGTQTVTFVVTID